MKEKCNARKSQGKLATRHICGLEKGHDGKCCCKRGLDLFSAEQKKRKICNFKWKRGS